MDYYRYVCGTCGYRMNSASSSLPGMMDCPRCGFGNGRMTGKAISEREFERAEFGRGRAGQ